jgi:transcriptional regulator with XRE-family HTH domain
MVVKKFGGKLRTLRKERRLSLRTLAATFGYQTHSYLNEIELGRKEPTVELVIQVSRYFGVTTDELLKDEIDIRIPKTPKSKPRKEIE